MCDFHEDDIREKFPDVIKVLLLDRTKSTKKKAKNIIWANNNYRSKGKEYTPTSQIKLDLITGLMEGVIKPRVLKNKDVQKIRTKQKAEVFTPTWIVKKQNDEVDKNYLDDDLETYIKRKWLEITCGEAPYIATRYGMENGKVIAIEKRVGFLDRKLLRICSEVNIYSKWQTLVEEAYKACYGFEWNGDSLFLARENLLKTYQEYYFFKWNKYPTQKLLERIAVIISYNIFQMDGLKYIIPLSEKKEKIGGGQLSLFGDIPEQEQWIVNPGIKVKIMNWEKDKMELFEKGLGE